MQDVDHEKKTVCNTWCPSPHWPCHWPRCYACPGDCQVCLFCVLLCFEKQTIFSEGERLTKRTLLSTEQMKVIFDFLAQNEYDSVKKYVLKSKE